MRLLGARGDLHHRSIDRCHRSQYGSHPLLVDAMHYAQLDEHGGSHGVRDVDALEAALARPRQKYAHDSAVDLATLAAAYAFGLARSHPYTDGNKRVAFLAAAVFFEIKGHTFERRGAEVVAAMTALAAGRSVNVLSRSGFVTRCRRWV